MKRTLPALRGPAEADPWVRAPDEVRRRPQSSARTPCQRRAPGSPSERLRRARSARPIAIGCAAPRRLPQCSTADAVLDASRLQLLAVPTVRRDRSRRIRDRQKASRARRRPQPAQAHAARSDSRAPARAIDAFDLIATVAAGLSPRPSSRASRRRRTPTPRRAASPAPETLREDGAAVPRCAATSTRFARCLGAQLPVLPELLRLRAGSAFEPPRCSQRIAGLHCGGSVRCHPIIQAADDPVLTRSGRLQAHARLPLRMDTQRLDPVRRSSAFSALFLWERWRAEQRPPTVHPQAPAKRAATRRVRCPIGRRPAAGAPAAHRRAACPGVRRQARYDRTDRYVADVDTLGGAITQLALTEHRDTEARGQALRPPAEERQPHLRSPRAGLDRRGPAQPSHALAGAARPTRARPRMPISSSCKLGRRRPMATKVTSRR